MASDSINRLTVNRRQAIAGAAALAGVAMGGGASAENQPRAATVMQVARLVEVQNAVLAFRRSNLNELHDRGAEAARLLELAGAGDLVNQLRGLGHAGQCDDLLS